MTAINNLVKVATGDLIVECDSDDYFTRDAFRVVVQALQACKDMGETYALVFLKYTKDGQMIIQALCLIYILRMA